MLGILSSNVGWLGVIDGKMRLNVGTEWEQILKSLRQIDKICLQTGPATLPSPGKFLLSDSHSGTPWNY